MESTEWNRRVTTLAEADTGERRSLQAHDHAALIYWSRQEFLDTIVPYIMEGLRDGDLVVHVAHDEPVEPLVEALEAAGADVEGARARGQLQLLKAAEAFAPEGRFEVEAAMAGLGETIEAAQAAGHGRIRFSVDLSYLLSGAPGVDDFLVFDSRANDEIFPRHPFICICAYDASRGAGHLVEDMFGTHPLVFVRGLPLDNPYYQPWNEISAQAAHLQRWKERYSAAAGHAPA